MTSATKNPLDQLANQSSSSSSSSSSTRAKTSIMTANANQSQDQQNQSQSHHQELIRLLAQHFNNQFYQLANNNQQNADHQPPPPPQLVNNFQTTLAQYQQQQQQQQQQQLQLQQQQQQQHFRAGQDAINFSMPSGSSSANLDQATASSSPTSFPATSPAPLRSQPLASAPVMGLGTNPACNPLQLPLNGGDLSLFGALNNCFGMSQDQFVLSLQQQYLLRAAASAAAASSATTPRYFDQAPTQDQQQHLANIQNLQLANQVVTTPSNRRNQPNKRETNTNAPTQNSRELLKFSINTILGRGSPLPPVNGPAFNATSTTTTTTTTTTTKRPTSNERLLANEKMARQEEAELDDQQQRGRHDHESISPECDPDAVTDVDSNSSSTPTPHLGHSLPGANHLDLQSASSSMLTNHQRLAVASANLGGNSDQHLQHQQSLSFLNSTTAFPWTAASRGKPRRGMMRRAVFSDSQRVGLEKRFQLQKYISKPDRKKLAEKLGLRDSQVKIWFQNRRMKWRNSKERELLSAGGSREQTLPTRNNPNPDLSDVGETIKRLVNAGTTNSINAV